jgi:hypothetical protein
MIREILSIGVWSERFMFAYALCRVRQPRRTVMYVHTYDFTTQPVFDIGRHLEICVFSCIVFYCHLEICVFSLLESILLAC